MDALGPESAVPNGIRISRSVKLQSTIATGIQLFERLNGNSTTPLYLGMLYSSAGYLDVRKSDYQPQFKSCYDADYQAMSHAPPIGNRQSWSYEYSRYLASYVPNDCVSVTKLL